MNPYLIPGLEAKPNGPLSPFTHPEHEDLYVEVDHSETRYQEFIRAIGDPTGLAENGRLVVAYGRELCGKTALLNRCAAWVEKGLAGKGYRTLILPFTDEIPASVPVQERQQRVFDLLVDDLIRAEWLTGSDLTKLENLQNDLGRGYRYLSNALPSNAVLIVLLPPSEIDSELVAYAGYVRGKLLLLAETVYIDMVELKWNAIQAACARSDAIRLRVERLRVDDGWLFAEARQRREQPDRGFPIVSQETMRKVTSGLRPSIGQLQGLLQGVYQEILEPSTAGDALISPQVDEVSYQDITDFFLRESGRGQTQ